MSLRNESILLRQVALVSYGTQFLRRELALESWYGHGLLRETRFQFRDLADNSLLADDFTLWLGILDASGAVRLTLHRAIELQVETPYLAHGDSDDYVVVVHFADGYQVWTLGTEEATWYHHPLFPSRTELGVPVFPDAAMYGSDIDSYWCSEKSPGRFDVSETDWKKLSAVIAFDLQIRIPSSHAPSGPFFVPMPKETSWEKLPVFPNSRGTRLAHQLVATLDWEQARFANETNPKNENSPYRNLDDEGVAQAEDWGRRLDSWMVDVLLRCANEYRGSASTGFYVFGSALPGTAVPDQTGEDLNLESPAPAELQAAQTSSESNDNWMRHVGFAIVIAVLSLLVLAVSNLISCFPWLAVLIALPWALWGKYKGS